MTVPTSPFKVLIVGGGPVGLVAAHMLSKLGIDFTILEKYRTVTPEQGASLAFWPPTFRVLDQLGLHDALAPLMNPLLRRSVLTQDGKVFYESDNTHEYYHGYKVQITSRGDFLKGLHNSLTAEARAKIFVNKHVTAIETTEDAVTVSCADGTTYTGDMLLGADGVHSTVRNLLSTPAAPELAFPAAFRVLFGQALRPASVPAEHLYESHGAGVASQLFTGKERVFYFVYEQLETTTTEQRHYAHADADDYAKRMAHIHLTPALTLGDIYPHSLGGGLTDLQEGLAQSWTGGHGRVALVGDAAHKVTPNLGWGFNSGVLDLVVISNALRHLLQDDGAVAHPTGEQLRALTAAYQAERIAPMTQLEKTSGQVLRASAWGTWLNWVLDRLVFPATGADQILNRLTLVRIIAASPVLEWLGEEHYAEGHVPWKHVSLTQAAKAQAAVTGWGCFKPLFVTVGAMFAHLMGQSGVKGPLKVD